MGGGDGDRRGAAAGQDGTGGSQSLFSKLDTDGDGSISKSEFESTLGQSGVDQSSADALFAKLDQNGDGSVSQSELSSAAHHGHHAHGAGGGGGGGDASSLLDSTGADGSQSQTATNADGSTTTTVTYADGSTVTLTTPAAQTSGGSDGDGDGSGNQASKATANNLVEQLIKLQAQLTNQQGSTVSALA